jgi:GR25 family glycosyltransferase involved in LPS biosynthesis
MSFREIGCAKSHNDARQLISEIHPGGVILEDDARISNMDDFFNQTRLFLFNHMDSPSVLSLTGFRGLGKKLVKSHKRYTLRLWGKPDLAVGYVLTSLAAAKLVEANSPITSVSDWPISSCKFHATLDPPIVHGDEETISTIDHEGDLRNGPRTLFKIKTLFFIPYFTKASLDIAFKEYFEKVFLSRFFWSIDLWRFKLKLKIYK